MPGPTTTQTPLAPSTTRAPTVAYFSMEVAIDPELPTYSGGLGVLAGDTLRGAADLGMPVCAVTLLHRQGYFRQRLDAEGRQAEDKVAWEPAAKLVPEAPVVEVQIEGRPLQVRAWRYDAVGERGHVVPVYFLDADLPANAPEDRQLTGQLYGGDDRYRLRQEAVLGLAGVAMLSALGLPPAARLVGGRPDAGGGLAVYHMNEGHAALLTLALVKQRLAAGSSPAEATAFVRERCVFTTHTPVPAGHDSFSMESARQILGAADAGLLAELGAVDRKDGGERLNMSVIALTFCRYVNGVAKRHGEVSQRMFPKSKVDAITNGVHAVSWTADAMRALFDKHLPGWRADNHYLRYACELPLDELTAAHRSAKATLFGEIKSRTSVALDPDAFTIGFARRAAEYKRADLLFHDVDQLAALAAKRPLQIVYAGKAHPKDFGGKALIERVYAAAKVLAPKGVRVVYLENYDMILGRLICSGVDLWLNNPVKPLEASGTSGMKAAINGVPNLSILDGWWVEGAFDGVTGWTIDDPADAYGAAKDDGRFREVAAKSIYSRLSQEILPLWYDDRQGFAEVMRSSIAINGPFFNTHRMVLQYFIQAYGGGVG